MMEITEDNDGRRTLVLTDLGSANGTWVKDWPDWQRLAQEQPYVLQPNAMFFVGDKMGGVGYLIKVELVQ